MDNEHVIKKLLPELMKLEEIQQYVDSVETRLDKLYLNRFPKKCSMCEKVFLNREEYLQATVKIHNKESPDGNILEDNGKVAEFRNCTCGSTLAIFTTCRRDNSEWGIKRRELFDMCREKLVEEYKVPFQAATYVLRYIFNGFSSKVLKMDQLPEGYKEQA